MGVNRASKRRQMKKVVEEVLSQSQSRLEMSKSEFEMMFVEQKQKPTLKKQYDILKRFGK